MSNPPTSAPSDSTPCRVLLSAVADALSLPPPATANDEVTFLRLSRDRARLVIFACRRVLLDREAHDADLLAIAGALREQAAEYPPDLYEHHPMTH